MACWRDKKGKPLVIKVIGEIRRKVSEPLAELGELGKEKRKPFVWNHNPEGEKMGSFY